MGDVRCWITVNCGALKSAFAEGLEMTKPAQGGAVNDLRGAFAFGESFEGEICDLGEQLNIDELTVDERHAILSQGEKAKALCAKIEMVVRAKMSAKTAADLNAEVRAFFAEQRVLFPDAVRAHLTPEDQAFLALLD